jgi:hypothetical protein
MEVEDDEEDGGGVVHCLGLRFRCVCVSGSTFRLPFRWVYLIKVQLGVTVFSSAYPQSTKSPSSKRATTSTR